MNLTQQAKVTGYLSAIPKSVAQPAITIASNASYPINIAVVNRSTLISDSQAKAAVAAVQVQVTRDFSPAWAINANVIFFSANQAIPSSYWQVVLFDTSDIAGALGYHDLTSSYQPLGKVFVRTAQLYGYSWTVALSHEIVEMLVDPHVNLTVFHQTSATSGRLYAYESADPVEADNLGYTINGVLVSDFVYPAYFDPYRSAYSTKFSYRNNVHAPFEVAHGGYANYFDLTGSGWKQIFASAALQDELADIEHYAPRVAMRMKPTGQRIRSTNEI